MDDFTTINTWTTCWLVRVKNIVCAINACFRSSCNSRAMLFITFLLYVRAQHKVCLFIALRCRHRSECACLSRSVSSWSNEFKTWWCIGQHKNIGYWVLGIQKIEDTYNTVSYLPTYVCTTKIWIRSDDSRIRSCVQKRRIVLQNHGFLFQNMLSKQREIVYFRQIYFKKMKYLALIVVTARGVGRLEASTSIICDLIYDLKSSWSVSLLQSNNSAGSSEKLLLRVTITVAKHFIEV